MGARKAPKRVVNGQFHQLFRATCCTRAARQADRCTIKKYSASRLPTAWCTLVQRNRLSCVTRAEHAFYFRELCRESSGTATSRCAAHSVGALEERKVRRRSSKAFLRSSRANVRQRKAEKNAKTGIVFFLQEISSARQPTVFSLAAVVSGGRPARVFLTLSLGDLAPQ